MRFSIIVPVCNSEPYLKLCLEGLLGQDLPRDQFEVICIDNNSQDGSVAIIRHFGPQIRLFSEPRQGAYAARNLAVLQAHGEVIAFTDADCVPHPDWLSRMNQAFSEDAAMVVMGHTRYSAGSGALKLLSRYEHHKDLYIFSSDDVSVYYGHTNNLATRREILDRFGPFTERRRGADVIFVRRVVDALGPGSVRYDPRAIVEHLEVDSLRKYYRKIFTYGCSRRRYGNTVEARPLNTRERFTVFRQTARREALSVLTMGSLLTLLAAGVGCWYTGALKGVIYPNEP